MIRRPLLAVATALAVATTLPASAGAIVVPVDATVAISGTPDLQSLFPTPVGFATATSQAVDRTGDEVVFTSSSDGLVADDDDTVANVYVKHIDSGAVELVSRASGEHGEPAHAACGSGVISADGEAVAFTCTGPLDPADQNGVTDVYVRSLDTKVTQLVSRGTNDLAADRGVVSTAPAIAHVPGVTFVAFTSNATNLLGSPAPPGNQIYRATVGQSGVARIELVSQSTAGVAAASATIPSISDDGTKVAFVTGTSLDAADTNPNADVYVRDLAGTPVTTLASRADGAVGGAAGGVSTGVISGDGSTVAFDTTARLDGRDVDGLLDVYVRTGSTTRLMSSGTNGERAGADCHLTSVNRSGTVVAFASQTTAFDPAVTFAVPQAYVAISGATGFSLQLVSRAAGAGSPSRGTFTVALSGDGTKVAMTVVGAITGDLDPNGQSVALRDLGSGAVQAVSRPAGASPFVNPGGDASRGAVSADGRYVAFESTAPALGLPAGAISEVYRRDLETGELTLVSRRDGPGGAPFDGTAFSPQISADGRRVAFGQAIPGQLVQVYVRDLAAGRTFAASRPDGPETPDGPLGDGSSGPASISDDGSRVAFLSQAKNLVGADDTDARQDAFVRELDTGRTLLVGRAAGDGPKASNSVDGLVISGDGRFVAFDSLSSNLVGGDSNGRTDVFVRGLDDGTIQRASVDAAGTQANDQSFAPSISRDGSRVSFDSDATNFDPPLAGRKLYLKDLTDGTLTVAGRADGPDGEPLVGDTPGVLSADGRHLAFSNASATSLAPGDPGNGVRRVYVRDLANGVTRLVSRRTGAGGDPVRGSLSGLTADGGCVVFSADGSAASPPGSTDHSGVFLRALVPNCGRPIPPPGPGPGPGPVKPAVLSRLSVRPARFYVGGRKGGTRIAFRLDKGVSVTLAFDRLLAGHRKGKRCLTTVRKGRRCTVVRRAGRLTVTRTRTGANTVKFSGKLGRKALAPGSYRLTATPLHGKAVTVRFVVVKVPKPKAKPRR